MSLQFHGIGHRYGRATPVFRDLDLDITSPATVLLGPNGAGKSTLMAIAASHLTASHGFVSWADLSPSTRRSRAAYRSTVAWLPQSVTSVPGLTVREQVA